LSQTISGYSSTLITLGDGGPYASPTTISATLQASGGVALLIANPWTVTLTGAIFSTSRYGNLVEADRATNFTNLATISGGASGINLYAGGTINNAGAISGYRYAINAYAGGQSSADKPFFNITNSAYLGASAGIGIFGGPGSIDNTGTIFGANFAILDVNTIVNNGFIHGRGFMGVGLGTGGTLVNQSHGRIIGGLFGVYGPATEQTVVENAGYGSLINTGTIESGGTGVYLSQPASLANAGLIQSEDFGGIGVSLAHGGDVSNSGKIIGFTGLVLDGGTLTNSGIIQGETHNNNSGLISPGVNATAIEFTGPGTFAEEAAGIVFGSIIGDGGALILEGGSLGQVSGFADDIFAGPHATLSLNLAGLGTISGFAQGDEITLTDQTAAYGNFYGNALTLSNGATLDFAGSYAQQHFTIAADPSDGTDITVACFLAGTRIATPQGETPVEQLTIGDLVCTLHAGPQPIKWLGRRHYAAPFCNHPLVLPIRIAAGALALGVPARDLFVSPGHALWAAGALVPAGRLVNGSSITQLPAAERLDYVHIELAAHDLLLADSCPAESLEAEGFRGLFHNAPSHHEAVHAPALPRLADGFMLHAIQRRLGAAQNPNPGPLRGFVDILTPGLAAGWAQNTAAPETPVVLDLLSGNRRVARVLSNQYRADLRRAGLGSGNHGFAIPLSAPIDRIRRACDGAALDKQAVLFLKKKNQKNF
jgi:hypothetical protein